MSEARPPETAPAPCFETFDSDAGFQRAVDLLLQQAGRELRVFDPDLAALHLNAPERNAQLERFLRASRTRRLYIAVHDTEHLTRFCPRMLLLLKRYAHAIQIQQTHAEIRELRDSFLVLDAAHLVRRPEAKSFRGVLYLDDHAEALGMRQRFLEIWSASFPAVPATTLGL